MRFNWLTVAAVVGLVAPAAGQVYVPIPVTGYTQDVIADAAGSPAATTTSAFDVGSHTSNMFMIGYALYEQGYNTAFPSRGVPASGLIVTSPSRSYQLGPIDGNNALQFAQTSGDTVSSGTLSLAAP